MNRAAATALRHRQRPARLLGRERCAHSVPRKRPGRRDSNPASPGPTPRFSNAGDSGVRPADRADLDGGCQSLRVASDLERGPRRRRRAAPPKPPGPRRLAPARPGVSCGAWCRLRRATRRCRRATRLARRLPRLVLDFDERGPQSRLRLGGPDHRWAGLLRGQGPPGLHLGVPRFEPHPPRHRPHSGIRRFRAGWLAPEGGGQDLSGAQRWRGPSPASRSWTVPSPIASPVWSGPGVPISAEEP